MTCWFFCVCVCLSVWYPSHTSLSRTSLTPSPSDTSITPLLSFAMPSHSRTCSLSQCSCFLHLYSRNYFIHPLLHYFSYFSFSKPHLYSVSLQVFCCPVFILVFQYLYSSLSSSLTLIPFSASLSIPLLSSPYYNIHLSISPFPLSLILEFQLCTDIVVI